VSTAATGNAPWGTPGHAANRHCPLGPAPAPVTSPPSVEWKEPSASAESVCVSKLWLDRTGHKSGSGFSDLAPSILHYNWF
jgi:hypothetical protein